MSNSYQVDPQRLIEKYRLQTVELNGRLVLVEAAFEQVSAELAEARATIDRMAESVESAPDLKVVEDA